MLYMYIAKWLPLIDDVWFSFRHKDSICRIQLQWHCLHWAMCNEWTFWQENSFLGYTVWCLRAWWGGWWVMYKELWACLCGAVFLSFKTDTCVWAVLFFIQRTFRQMKMKQGRQNTRQWTFCYSGDRSFSAVMSMRVNLQKQIDFIWQRAIERCAQLEQPGINDIKQACANEMVGWVGNQVSSGFINHFGWHVWAEGNNRKK